MATDFPSTCWLGTCLDRGRGSLLLPFPGSLGLGEPEKEAQTEEEGVCLSPRVLQICAFPLASSHSSSWDNGKDSFGEAGTA